MAPSDNRPRNARATLIQLVLACPTCSLERGREGDIHLGSVEVDQGHRRITIDSGGVREETKEVGPEQTSSTVTINTVCADGHAFRLLFRPEPRGPIVVTAEATLHGTPPL